MNGGAGNGSDCVVEGPQPGPLADRFFETMTAYQHTAVLKAAIEFNLFPAIGSGHNNHRGR